MRGRIIHYNANDGKGLIAAEGHQHPFDISLWASDTAPAVNHTVTVELVEGQLAKVERVSDNVLLKEAASDFASKAGEFGQNIGANLGAASSSDGRSIIEKLGKPVLIAYAAFLIGSTIFNYLVIDIMGIQQVGKSLFNLSELPQFTSGSQINGSAFAVLALLSILLPIFWQKRWSWLALLMPLIATLNPIYSIASAVLKFSRQMGGNPMADKMSEQMIKQMMEMVSLGLGFWLCIAASIVLALIGVKRLILTRD